MSSKGMDHAIESLKEYIIATIDVYADDSRAEIEPELKVYVKAINIMEKHEFGKEITNLNDLLDIHYPEGEE